MFEKCLPIFLKSTYTRLMVIQWSEFQWKKLNIVHFIILTVFILFIFNNLLRLKTSRLCYNCVSNPKNRSIETHKEIHQQPQVEQKLHPRKWIELYKQQLLDVQKAPILPTYQNYHLQIRFNRTNLLMDHDLTHDSDRLFNTNQYIHVKCFESRYLRFNFTINFIIDTKNSTMNNITWKVPDYNASILRVSLLTSDLLIIDVQKRFLLTTTFTFMYQWSYSNISKLLHWPVWPLQNDSHPSHLQTSLLQHSSAQELFLAEQRAIRHWLDLQYNATNSTPSRSARRLTPFEISSNTSICSTQFFKWIQNYTRWHANVTYHLSDPLISSEKHQNFILKNDIRFILYETLGSGTADRITHLVTTYLISILTNRIFIFDPNWPEFSDAMQSVLYDTRREIIPWFNSYLMWKNFTIGNYRFGIERLVTDYDYNKKFPERFLIIRAHTGGLAQMLSSKKSVYQKFLTEDLGMNVNNLFGCLYHALIVYRLSVLVERTASDTYQTFGHSGQQLLQTVLAPEIYPIGIQVRTGDGFLKEVTTNVSILSDNSTLKSFANYIDCVHHFVQGHQSVFRNSSQMPVALIVSDTLTLRRTILKRWQYPFSCLHSTHSTCRNSTTELYFLASPDPVLHVAYTNQRGLAFNLAMFDTFLLSLCEQHLITHDSGFGRIGVFAALKQRNIFSFSPNQYLLCSNMKQSISLQESAFDWSGI